MNKYEFIGNVSRYPLSVKYRPIYEILMFEKCVEDKNGFPDMGCKSVMGFYYDLDFAIDAMNDNALDIREGGVYNYGFIQAKWPGLYNSLGEGYRMFFEWDEDKDGFHSAEEPDIFKHYAF